MKRFKLITIFLGVMLWVLGLYTASFAQTSNTKINNSKVGQDMRDVKQNSAGTFDGNGKRTTSVQGVSGTKPSMAGQPATVIHPKAATSMKSVDHAKVPPPSTSRSSSPSSGSKPSSSSPKK